jgi:O-antigen/teichoic acid export membrane protein
MKKVRTGPRNAATREVPPISLRRSFGWTFAGNTVYAAGQWAILSLIAKLGGSEMLGHYALALALTTPAVMLTHLNLRAVVATDVEARYPFGDYLAVRLGTTAAGLAAIAGLAFASSHFRPLAMTILVTGLSQSAETVSDLFHGALQRRERMGQIARSMMARAIVSVAALGIVLWWSHDLVSAVVALALGRLAVLLAYDLPRGVAGECLSGSGWRAELAILRTALPLGVVLMLVSLSTNLPRYAIGHDLGTRELGVFAAVVSFMTAGSTVVHALGQVATPRLARYFSERNLPRFRQMAFQLAGLVLASGVAGMFVATLFGKVVLRVLYRPEYAVYSGLLVAVMAAAIPGYLAIAFGYVITSARAFNAQMPLFCCVAACCGVVSWVLVPRIGLPGAVLALAAAACVQIGGEALILARALQRMEPAS